MNLFGDPLKRIREQLKAPAADQGLVTRLSYRAQRELSLLKEGKSIKRSRPRFKVSSLQQQQHSRPDPPEHMMSRFKYQPQSDIGVSSMGLMSPRNVQQQQQQQVEVERHEDPAHSPAARPIKLRSAQSARPEDAASVATTAARSKKARLPGRGDVAPGEEFTSIRMDFASMRGRDQETKPQAGARRPVWYCLQIVGEPVALPEATCRELEGAFRSGRTRIMVKVEGREQRAELGEAPMTLTDTASGETCELLRDDFADVDFYGRKEYLARHRQADLAKIRQRREDRRMKRLKHKAPEHCHIWHNPKSEEVSKIPCQFPAGTLQNSMRAIVAHSAGARHVAACNDAPSLEEALPKMSLVLPDASRRLISRRSSHRNAVSPLSEAASGTADIPVTVTEYVQDASSAVVEPQPVLALPPIGSGALQSPVPVPASPAGAATGSPTSQSAAPTAQQQRPRGQLPALSVDCPPPAVWDAAAEGAEAEAGQPSGISLQVTRSNYPISPSAQDAPPEDDDTAHHYQLFVNNFAGIRTLIAEMNKPGGLPRLDLPKERPGRRRSPDGDRVRGDSDGRPRSKSPKQERPTSSIPFPSSAAGSQKGGSDSDDDWDGESSDEPQEAHPSPGGKRRDLSTWHRALMSWQGPLDLRDDEQGSSSSGDGDNYDANCTICRMYEERGRIEATAKRLAASSADNPFLTKTQEWKNLVYSAKLQISLRLHDALDERQATKSYVMQSPSCVAQLGRAAEGNARQWETGRFTMPPSAAECQGTMPTIWNRASAQLRLQRHRTAQCILLYARLLWYLEKLGGPTTQAQVDLVNTVRSLLIQEHRVSRRLLFDLLREAGPQVVESRDNMKIIHYLRIELGLSGGDLVRFIRRNKHKGWAMTRDLQILADKIKKREQTTGRGKNASSPRT